MLRPMGWLAPRVAFAAVAAAALPAQQRLLVPSQYSTLAAAVAAANDGDTIELASGVRDMGGITITKTLNIIGTGSVLAGYMTIAIPSGKALSMIGCSIGDALLVADLFVTNSAGRVTIA